MFRRAKAFHALAAIFAIAVLLNYPWELAQSGLYGAVPSIAVRLRHCFVASLGDGVMVVAIHGSGSLAFRDLAWFANPRTWTWLTMIGAGLTIAIIVEWAAVYVGRWSYGPDMPMLPGLGVALLPVAQMVVLPPIVFQLVSRIR